MNLRLASVLFVCLISAPQLWAQKGKPKPDSIQSFVTNVELSQKYLPKVLPPSPDAASLARYGEVPVDLSKGIPSISIPIYEIQSGSLKVPISLSYHASGLKVNDVASSTGTGWSLNAGGAITRAVNSLPDEANGGFFGNPVPTANTAEEMCYIGRLAAGDGVSKDGSPDFFFYNYNGSGGKFMYANKRRTIDANLSNLAIVSIPYRPIQIGGNTTSGYKITEVDGTIYQFGGQVNTKGSIENANTSDGLIYNSTWFLSHMVSANRVDTIFFEYSDVVGVQAPPLHSTSLIKKVFNGGLSTTMDYQRSPTVTVTNFTRYPAAIYFKNGKVTFTYTSDRQDLPSAKRLSAIYIYRKDAAGNYIELKHFDFTHTYFSCQDVGQSQFDRLVVSNHTTTNSHILKRLRLDSVTEKSASGTALPSFQLAYYQGNLLPMYGTYGQDYFGFYNGKNNNENLLVYDTDASRTQPPSTTYGADRSVDFNYAVLGSLKEIIYPTGGKSTFAYEAPVTAGSGSPVQGGGIRIKSITNSEGGIQLTKKVYTYPGAYQIGNLVPGNNAAGIEQAFSLTEQVPNPSSGTADSYIYSTWQENFPFMLGGNSGSSVAYSQVEVSDADASNALLGKTISKFTTSNDGTPSTFPFNTIPNEWRRGQLWEESIVNSTGNVVKKTVNKYTEVLTDSLVKGYGARLTFKANPDFASPSYCSPSEEAARTDYQWASTQLTYQIGSLFLDSTMTYTYSETGGSVLFEKKEFTYAKATHHQVTRQRITNSKNQIEETNFKYPHELASGNADYQEMVNRHIYAPVLEQEDKVNGSFTSLVKTNFKKWYPATTYGGLSGFFAPLSVQQQFAGGSLVNQIVFGENLTNPTENGYDNKGHAVVYTELNGTVTRLTWWTQNGKQDQVNVKQVNGAFSTTYDYHPLVGVKSIINPDGKAVFYEYDVFNRLSKVHNDTETGPVLKSFCYNYAGQSISCDAITGISGVASLDPLTLLPDSTAAMPVTLIELSAIKQEQTSFLSWKTTEESNSDRFEVERSADGKHWGRIGSVVAKGESNSLLYYTFRDNQPNGGQNLYRLKMVDHDGSFSYSRVESLTFDDGIAVYPNPVGPGDKLLLKGIQPEKISNLAIYDQQGKRVYSAKPKTERIDTTGLPAGSYLVQVTQADGTVVTLRFVKK